MDSKRILYIEDNFQNKRLVKKILNSRGYEVLEAEDGITGVDMALAERPDLILMDINIPGIDGTEATAILKNSEAAYIPIIALTANAMVGDRERIMAAGCDEYLQKPINNALLLETVRRFVGDSDNAAVDQPASHASIEKPKSTSVNGYSSSNRPLATLPGRK
jgi:two-component system, cell cycle response regulator DivK